jgi:hypothetical protein
MSDTTDADAKLPAPPAENVVKHILGDSVKPHDAVQIITHMNAQPPEVHVNGAKDTQARKHLMAYLGGRFGINDVQVETLCTGIMNSLVNVNYANPEHPSFIHSAAMWADAIRQVTPQSVRDYLGEKETPLPPYDAKKLTVDTGTIQRLLGKDVNPDTLIAIAPSDDRIAPPGVMIYGDKPNPENRIIHVRATLAHELGIDPIDCEHLLSALGNRASARLLPGHEPTQGDAGVTFGMTANTFARVITQLSRDDVKALVQADVARLKPRIFTRNERGTGVAEEVAPKGLKPPTAPTDDGTTLPPLDPDNGIGNVPRGGLAKTLPDPKLEGYTLPAWEGPPILRGDRADGPRSLTSRATPSSGHSDGVAASRQGDGGRGTPG